MQILLEDYARILAEMFMTRNDLTIDQGCLFIYSVSNYSINNVDCEHRTVNFSHK